MSQKNSTLVDYVSKYNSAKGSAKSAVRAEVIAAMSKAAMDGDLASAQAYAEQHAAMKVEVTKAPAITRDVLIARRIAELNAAIDALKSDEDYSADATVGDEWTVDPKRVDSLTAVRSTTKAATYRGATGDFVGQVAAAIGSGDYTVSAFIKAGFAAGVTHPTGNKAPNGAVGAWMDKRRDDTVDFDDASVTITTNSDGVAILRVA